MGIIKHGLVMLMCMTGLYAEMLAEVNGHQMHSYDLNQLMLWKQWLNNTELTQQQWVDHWVDIMAMYDAIELMDEDWQDQSFELYHPELGVLSQESLEGYIEATLVDWEWLQDWLNKAEKVSFMKRYYFKNTIQFTEDDVSAFQKRWNDQLQEYHLWLLQVSSDHEQGLVTWLTHPRRSTVPDEVIKQDQGWLSIHHFPQSIQNDLMTSISVTPLYRKHGQSWVLWIEDQRLGKALSWSDAEQKLSQELTDYHFQQWRLNALQQAHIKVYDGET